MKSHYAVSNFTRSQVLPALLATVLFSLSACGGGGGGGGGNTGVIPPPPPARTPQTVVFLATEPNLQQIHLFSASDEGGALLQLTPAFANASGRAVRFAVSPDRQHVAYAADANTVNTLEVFVVPISGGTPVQVSSGFPANTQVFQIAWAPDSSQIAYVANPQGRSPRGFSHWEVFLADRDGSNDRKINGSVGSPPSVSVLLVKWSPDSRYLAQTVFSLDPFQTAIGINTYDTTLGAPNSTRITPTLDYLNGERMGSNLAWSPDSTKIAYRSAYEAAGTTHLYAVGPDGSGNTRMNGTLAAGGDVSSFKWAPDGSRIAYLADKLVNDRIDMFVSNDDGTNIQRIDSGSAPTRFSQYTWAPDSSRILYVADQDTAGVFEIYVSNADGDVAVKAHAPLTSGQFAVNGVWSPDGQQIAYRANIDSASETDVYVSNADGSSLVKVNGPMVANGRAVSSPKWSPDGSRVAYVATQDDADVQELYVSTVNGLSNNRVNADITGADVDIQPSNIDWSDDGTRLAFFDVFDDFFDSSILDLWVGTTDGAAPIVLNDSNDFFGSFAY